MTTVLAPIRYPPSERSFSTVERGLEILDGDTTEQKQLIILHVNMIQEGRRVTRTQLERAVNQRFAGEHMYYVVRSGLALKEAIIDEAVSRNVDHVVIGASSTQWLRQKLLRFLGTRNNLGGALEAELDVTFEMVA